MADTPTRKERRAQRKLAKKEQARDPMKKAAEAFEDGMALHQQGHLAKAEAAYRGAVAANGDFAEAHLNLGVVLHAQGNNDTAAQSFERAIALNPDLAEAQYGFGVLLQDQGKTEDAAARFRRALEIDPDFILPINGLAIAEQKLGHWDVAVEGFERALRLNSGFAEAANNLGVLRHKQGRLDDAMASFLRALEARPDYAEAHRNYSHVLLLAGFYAEGWREFQWRWQCDDFPSTRQAFPYPRWLGEPVDGKEILVWGEQGVGDEVYFASMVPDLIDQGAEVILESDSRLVPLFQRSFPGVTCIGQDATVKGDIDFQVPSGDLGNWLRPDLNSFPERNSFLIADAARAENLKFQYRNGGGDFLVGLAWISKNPEVGGDKSMALMDWTPLAGIPGVTVIDLQYGDTEAERRAFEAATGTIIIRDDTIDQMDDLDAFAAQILAMDLVISVSNTTAHISGGLGVPTWVLLHVSPLSVWRQDGDTSPWYPSIRLFRQSKPGAWTDVITQVESALKALQTPE